MNEDFDKNLLELGRKYGNIVFIYEKDAPFSDVVEKYFPERSFNMGLARKNVAMCAAGFCLRGKTPLILAGSGFVEDAFTEVRSTIALPNLNVKIVNFGGNAVFDKVGMQNVLPNVSVYEESGDLVEMLKEYGVGYLSLSILS